MREFVTLPNLITSGNIASGFAALVVLPTSAVWAAALVALAAGFDAVDGPLARRQGKDATFGAALDSLADMVSFGVVPAMATYLGALSAPLPVRALVAGSFVLCGAWRLARFPLVKQRRSFVGLPVPVAGLAVMLVATLDPTPVLALLVAAALAALMVSAVPFPNLCA
ncbi:MAG: CDP-diacylglycerol--serine O-phosphatidyltransferase, partial [Actinomycetota bacterium]|nr:CDP-diacylglycerol--serine O-phosphatidyltransferase [Actinomycetota bacterium]